MTQYYFLSIFLPELGFEAPPEADFFAVIDAFKKNLKPKDYEQIKTLRRYYDIENIRSFYLEEPLNPFGNLDENELEDWIVTGIGLPEYVYDFFEKYPQREGRLEHFPELIEAYFNEEIKAAKGPLKDFLQLERDFRLLQTAFRAKRLGWDVVKELQFEDPDDEIVAQILAQKDAKTFEPPVEFEEFKPIYNQYLETPMMLKKQMAMYKIKKIDEVIGLDLFSMRKILGYFLQLIQVESWFSLNKKRGLEIVDNIVRRTS